MGNAQSSSKDEAQNDAAADGQDSISRLSRFQTAASTDSASGNSAITTPTLRRLSTTATGSASHHQGGGGNRKISVGSSRSGRRGGNLFETTTNGLSPSSTIDENPTNAQHTLLRASSSDRRASASASSSPRALDREQAWLRSAHSSNTNRSVSSSNNNRSRSRSGSIGNLLSGGSISRREKANAAAVAAAAAAQRDGKSSVSITSSGGDRGSELIFRRKKSIELSDLDDRLTFSEAGPSSGVNSPSPPQRQFSQDSTTLLSPGSTDASHASSSGKSRLRSISSPIDDESTESSSFSHSAGGSDLFNPMFPSRSGNGVRNDGTNEVTGNSNLMSTLEEGTKDPLGRKQPTALPSYLKIPTLIPSAYASPSSSEPSSPHPLDQGGAATMEDEFGSSVEGQNLTLPSGSVSQSNRKGLGGSAAAAVLNTEDVVLAPGEAGRVSSPSLVEDADSSQDTEPAKATAIANLEAGEVNTIGDQTSASEHSVASALSSTASDHSTDQRNTSSRTPTPTPGSMGSGRAMTPTEARPGVMSSLSSTGKREAEAAAAALAAASEYTRKTHAQLFTGSESGTTTPALPIGLTSAPSSALTPAIPTYGADNSTGTSTPLTKETNNLKLTLPERTPTGKDLSNVHQTPTGGHSRGATITPSSHRVTSSNVPLVPITVKWRGGGKEVFVTGTFANEWRSKILLRKIPTSTGKRPEYSCVLHLAPGTHRLKFIVDDRWRVSRDLSTASDGEGNLTNYIEVAHTGPAHPGPLSAPGEDLLAAPGEDEEVKRKKEVISGHKATNDLIEEARRAEALQRGNLLDVFGEDKVRLEERWTQEIPPSIIQAQASEEAYRTELENVQASNSNSSSSRHHQRDLPPPPADVPVPPILPRQLEKVILNSTSAAVIGTVDDNSVLPAPNHAVLHHLTASAIKSGVIATGCTVRYRKKYITTVYYRAAS